MPRSAALGEWYAGTAAVPRASSLGEWCDKQRVAHRAGALRSDRRAKLDGIGFEWTAAARKAAVRAAGEAGPS